MTARNNLVELLKDVSVFIDSEHFNDVRGKDRLPYINLKQALGDVVAVMPEEVEEEALDVSNDEEDETIDSTEES